MFFQRLALYQWKQDINAAERCCNEMLRIDRECTLAQLSLQQSKIERSVEIFTAAPDRVGHEAVERGLSS